MIIGCLREDMSNALQGVQRAISGKSVMPALSGVMLSAEDDRLRLHATDLEIYLRSSIPGKIESAGKTLVNGKLLSDIVRNIDSDMISMESSEGQLEIKGGGFKSSLRTLPVEDFPVMPEDRETMVEKVPMDAFRESISQVVRAASRDDKRPVLQGVLLEINDNVICLVSTDSYRLAATELNIEGALKTEEKVIIPARAMQELHRWSGRGEELRISRTEGQIRFDMGESLMLAREIEGKFPNWRQLIPEGQKISIKADRDRLLSTIKRVSLIGTTVVMDVVPGQIVFSAESRDVGRAEERMEAEVSGGEMKIAFNSEFLTDGISACSGENITLLLDDPEKPGVLTCEGNPYRYLIMPIKI